MQGRPKACWSRKRQQWTTQLTKAAIHWVRWSYFALLGCSLQRLIVKAFSTCAAYARGWQIYFLPGGQIQSRKEPKRKQILRQGAKKGQPFLHQNKRGQIKQHVACMLAPLRNVKMFHIHKKWCKFFSRLFWFINSSKLNKNVFQNITWRKYF